ncbi:hypothetical protein ABW636_14175 [Aquimarina sp. 2201CG1-2-11]|uniref:hypothetical protein n=1 Tax=Aquimarina discodermiae TaxID=3231043 RepID=UPI003462EBFD
MNIKKDQQYYDFYIQILKAFHLDPILFFTRVANNVPYDTKMYSWIHQLYHEGKSVQDSIDRIYTARHILYFKGKDIITIPKKNNDFIDRILLEYLEINRAS